MKKNDVVRQVYPYMGMKGGFNGQGKKAYDRRFENKKN